MDEEQYDMLLELANAFLQSSRNVSTAELSEGLVVAFGDQYWDEPLAKPFSNYFNERDPKAVKPTPPQFPGGVRSESPMEIDGPTSQPLPQLSNSALQAATDLARDFPTELSEVRTALEGKATVNILANNGQGAPRVRSPQARNATHPYSNRVPVAGISLTPSSSSTPTPSFSAPAPSSPPDTIATPNIALLPGQSTLQNNWGMGKITATRQATIDYFLLRMVICCALAFSLLDNGFFTDFCIAMCPNYAVPDRPSFFVKHIASETAYVMKQLKQGGGDEIYTVHVTTPNRMSFLVEGLVLTGFSTSGESIFNRLLAVIALYLAVNFSLVVSDTTKNVKKCRRLICEKFPWILNCPDPCHQLNLLSPVQEGFTD
ncbi:hypothetical protein B0H13DRAFT_1901688 [Mycena leptocephala]|nr:hypothetical protein B0H13DRAFT_1901688 [Mycena leptocephala]